MKRRTFLQTAGAALAAAPFTAGAQQKLATRPIPATGEALPVVGYGSSPVFNGDDWPAAAGLLDALHAAGGGFVDTWPDTQATLGRYGRERGATDDLFLATNIRTGSEEADLSAIAAAREAQGKAALDMLQLARPDDARAQWVRLLRWKDAGHARYIGIAISNSSAYGTVEGVIRNGADFVQINYSLLEPQAEERLIPFAHDHGVAVVTNRPFVNGQFFPLVRERELPAWAADFDCHSWAQFSLKWILGNPLVNCAITETTKLEHAVDNLGAGFGRFPDTAERARMMAYLQAR